MPEEVVKKAKIDASYRMAEESDLSAKMLADAVGHTNVEGFRQAFRFRPGVSLVECRRRFAA